MLSGSTVLLEMSNVSRSAPLWKTTFPLLRYGDLICASVRLVCCLRSLPSALIDQKLSTPDLSLTKTIRPPAYIGCRMGAPKSASRRTASSLPDSEARHSCAMRPPRYCTELSAKIDRPYRVKKSVSPSSASVARSASANGISETCPERLSIDLSKRGVVPGILVVR